MNLKKLFPIAALAVTGAANAQYTELYNLPGIDYAHTTTSLNNALGTTIVVPVDAPAGSTVQFNLPLGADFGQGGAAQLVVFQWGTNTILGATDIQPISNDFGIQSFNPVLTQGFNAGDAVSFMIVTRGTANLLFNIAQSNMEPNGVLTYDATAIGLGSGWILDQDIFATVAVVAPDVTPSVPEPSTYGMMGAGLLAIGALARRRATPKAAQQKLAA